MIRFSHAANSWQLGFTTPYKLTVWFNISPEQARERFDIGCKLWHEQVISAL